MNLNEEQAAALASQVELLTITTIAKAISDLAKIRREAGSLYQADLLLLVAEKILSFPRAFEIGEPSQGQVS